MRETKQRRVWSYGVIVGLELILVGIILFLMVQDVLSNIETVAYFLLGMGAIFFFDIMARYAQLAPRRLLYCRLVISLVFLSAGGAVLGGIISWWPLIVIFVGVGVLLNALLRK